MHNPSRATLQLTFQKPSPFLRGMVYFLLTLFFVILVAEMIARSPLAEHVPAPSILADSFLLDAKTHQLESQVRRDGRLDCLFIGSSITNSDVDPSVIERIYRERTGETIHCFNFGAPAMTAANASAFVDAVIVRYRPRLLVYTFVPRDIIAAKNNLDFAEASPWFQQEPQTVQAWLIQNSYAYRYFQTWRYLLLAPNRAKRIAEIDHLHPDGFQPTFDIRDPYPETINLTPELAASIWQTDYSRTVLENLLARRSATMNILLVEGPIYRSPNDGNLWAVYESEYIPALQALAQGSNITYLRSTEMAALVPTSGWYDQLHFNNEGAQIFSAWLGEYLAAHSELIR